MDENASARLTAWIASQLVAAHDVRLEGFEVADFGHSAETLLFSVAWQDDDGDQREEVVLRTRPPGTGLLPPYDLGLQFKIPCGLEGTAARAPRALWFEPTGAVLGRDFYVMERIDGDVFERTVPDEIAADPARIRRMTEEIVEQVAAIHSVDLEATLLWAAPVGLPFTPGALTIDEVIDRYEELTGIRVRHGSWYRAFQMLKTAVIMLSGSMLFDSRESDDLRFAEMGLYVSYYTQRAFAEFGIDDDLESGPVAPRPERIDAVKAGQGE